MAARFHTMNATAGFCMPYAAEGTSACVYEVLGTALLAVSIIIRLIALLVLKV